MDIDKTPNTEFGWIRMGIYTVITMVTWVACWFVAKLVTTAMHQDWVGISIPSAGLAVALGAAWEFMRRDKARKQAR